MLENVRESDLSKNRGYRTSKIAKSTQSSTLALLLFILSRTISPENRTVVLVASLQSTVSKALWLFGTRPLHCSVVRRSMEVHPCPEEFKQAGEVRPVVVLFGWLLAKSRHLHKYGELYHQHGADVITVKLEVMEVKRL